MLGPLALAALAVATLASEANYEVELAEGGEEGAAAEGGGSGSPRFVRDGDKVTFVGPEGAGEAGGDSAVQELTIANFDPLLANGSRWLVMVYAPWCGHCRRMAPQLEAVAAAYAGPAGGIAVGKVDGTTEVALSVRFMLGAFPLIFSVDGGALRYYDGPRSEAGLRDYLDGDYAETAALGWLNPLNPMAPWLSWPYRFHPLRLLFGAPLALRRPRPASALKERAAVCAQACFRLGWGWAGTSRSSWA